MSAIVVNITLELHNYSTSMIDRGAFILCAPILIGVYRTQNKALFAYAATTMLIQALAGNFMSYTRVLLVVFPMFIYIGTRFRRCEYVAIPMFACRCCSICCTRADIGSPDEPR